MKEMTNYIVERLKKYKENSSTIETTLARIETYEKALDNPESYTHIRPSSQYNIGIINGKGGKPPSPVEQSLLSKEGNEEEVIANLKEWIKEDKSRIYPLQIEKEQIDGALNALTKEQRHILECKYFENMTWRNIEDDFNNEFKQRNYITTEGIRKLNRQAFTLIIKILEPYYCRFKL